jgi:asparagine N-glycosylation enzyme membrane subunit Stt3
MSGFGTPPKERVIRKFEELFDNKHEIDVIGHRFNGLEAKQANVPRGRFVTQLFVDGKSIASSGHSDWRKAYRLLEIEVEKLFTEGVQF